VANNKNCIRLSLALAFNYQSSKPLTFNLFGVWGGTPDKRGAVEGAWAWGARASGAGGKQGSAKW
jgi:hypothetical protein